MVAVVFTPSRGVAVPELPEVEAARSVIDRAALGRLIVDVDDTSLTLDVRAGTFPSSAETYHMTDRMTEALGLYGDANAVEPELTQ